MGILCRNYKCDHISKRKTKWQTKDGKPLYRCTLQETIISEQYDPDSESSFANNSICINCTVEKHFAEE